MTVNQFDYLVSPASSSPGHLDLSTSISPCTPLSIWGLSRALVLLSSPTLISSHGITNHLFSGNFQIHFSSQHSLPNLQTHKTSGEVPPTQQTELTFLPTQSGNLEVLQLPSPRKSIGGGTLLQAIVWVCKGYDFVLLCFVLKHVLHQKHWFRQFKINSTN